MKGCVSEPETEIWNYVEMENPAGRVFVEENQQQSIENGSWEEDANNLPRSGSKDIGGKKLTC